MNLTERAIDRTEISFWHGLSATKHPLGIYDCSVRDHQFGNEFNVTSGKTYTIRVIAKRTKGSLGLAGGIWYTAKTSGNAWDGYAPFTLVGEASEDGLGVYERKFVVENGKTKAKIFIRLEQFENNYTTTWRLYDAQVFDENGQHLVTDQNNLGGLTNPMAAPDDKYSIDVICDKAMEGAIKLSDYFVAHAKKIKFEKKVTEDLGNVVIGHNPIFEKVKAAYNK